MRRSLIISAAAVALALVSGGRGAVPRQIDVRDDLFAPKRPPDPELRARPQLPLVKRRRDG